MVVGAEKGLPPALSDTRRGGELKGNGRQRAAARSFYSAVALP
ncbi:hypothetical protein BN2497_1703 [Janthinobacterium sp. CG23_2]|nr:hypothetical protein BN2497_1703 [Janthinobacterium sp. CG23_2]CUU27249.1 hypothetical protein BN3177_1703 [Janthinobacterium sp. CG23_2]